MIQAITIHKNGVTEEFTPTGVENEWELKIITAYGPQPGGIWENPEVAAWIVDNIYGE